MPAKTAYRVATTTADILHEPFLSERIDRRESQLLLGEIFVVEAIDGKFLKGRSRVDGYKGYMHSSNLRVAEGKATDFVDNKLSIIHSGPDIKTRSITSVSFMSRLEIEPGSLRNGFMRACGHGWIPAAHIKPLSTLRERIDHVEQALLMLDMPYRYGGRSALGLDCSALVQNAMMRSGYGRIPRDTDMQEKSERLGPKVHPEGAQRGDIVFFPLHVAIMVDRKNVISATEKFSGVVIEKLDDLADRQGGITSVRRPAYVL